MTDVTWRVLAVVILIGQSTTFARLLYLDLGRTYRAFLILSALCAAKSTAFLFAGFDSVFYKRVFIVAELVVIVALAIACVESYSLTARLLPKIKGKAKPNNVLAREYLALFLCIGVVIGLTATALAGGSIDPSRWVWSVTAIRCTALLACGLFVLAGPYCFRRRFVPFEPLNLTWHKIILTLLCSFQGIMIALTIYYRSTNPWNVMLLSMAAFCWCVWPWIFTIKGQDVHEYTDDEKRRLRDDLGLGDNNNV